MSDNGVRTQQLLARNAVASRPDGPDAIASVLGALWYNIFATNDAHDKLGGNPFGNNGRSYSDPLLNTR